MIIKKRTKTLNIQINEALLRRLLPTYPKLTRISQDLAMWKAGLKGEEETDYYLRFLPEKDFYIFQGLRLQHSGLIFQIDTLLLSPNLNLLIEVKNYSGTLIFDPDFKQLIRIRNDKEDGFEDPLVQARRHQYMLTNWMKEHQLPPLPIDYLVGIGKSTTILKNPKHNREVYDKVCLASNLLFKINDLKSKHQKEILSTKEIKKWSKTLLKNHLPSTPSYPPYQITTSDITSGIQCPACSAFCIYRMAGKWHCSACGNQSKDAHHQAINDYFLLVQGSITNKQFRDFLHVPSQKLASKLLAEMELESTGITRGKCYFPKSFETL